MWMATASWAATFAANQPPPSTVITGPVQALPLFSPWMTSHYRPAGMFVWYERPVIAKSSSLMVR